MPGEVRPGVRDSRLGRHEWRIGVRDLPVGDAHRDARLGSGGGSWGQEWAWGISGAGKELSYRATVCMCYVSEVGIEGWRSLRLSRGPLEKETRHGTPTF